MTANAYDTINYWSEVKLDIIKEYAAAYSRILSARANPSLHHLYIDGFSGAGVYLSKGKNAFVAGSPVNALRVAPPFREYHFVDLNSKKISLLRDLVGDRHDVTIYEGDCNQVLLDSVLPRARYEDYRRALCVLDPYGLHLNWEVVETAGKMRSVEIFLNFPVADMNRNVLWRNSERVEEKQKARMDAFWGDGSWKDAAYSSEGLLFDDMDEKKDNRAIAMAFRDRLKTAAGFSYVPDPVPMHNTKGAEVYYLFFAARNYVGAKIVAQIFDKYRGHA